MNTRQFPTPTSYIDTFSIFNTAWVILLLAKVESFLPADEAGQCNVFIY